MEVKRTFTSYSVLKAATKSWFLAKKGDIVYCEEEDKKYGFDGKEWQPLVASNTEVPLSTGLTNYEANKQLISKLPPISEEEYNQAIDAINAFEERTGNTYYMLLSKDYSYYTVLAYNPIDEYDFNTIGEGVMELLKDLGTIRTYHVLPDKDNEGIELWVTINKETYCFYLFGYDIGVVTYGK